MQYGEHYGNKKIGINKKKKKIVKKIIFFCCFISFAWLCFAWIGLGLVGRFFFWKLRPYLNQIFELAMNGLAIDEPRIRECTWGFFASIARLCEVTLAFPACL